MTRHIFVTQSQAHLAPLAIALASRDVILNGTSLIETQPIAKTLPDLTAFDWIFFTSQTAVQMFFSQIEHTTTTELPRIAVVGPQTEKSILQTGHPVHFVSPIFHAQSAAKAFIKQQVEDSTTRLPCRILWPCAQNASPEMAKIFNDHQAFSLVSCPIYQTKAKLFTPSELASLQEEINQAQAILFTSPSNLESWLNQKPALQMTENIAILSIGPSTTKALHEKGISPLLEASPHQVSSAIEAYLFSNAKEPKAT